MPIIINLDNLNHHELARLFYDLAQSMERLPADPRQTALLNRLHELKRDTAQFINQINNGIEQ